MRSNSTVRLDSLLVPYPQYGTITQTNTNGKLTKTHSIEIRALAIEPGADVAFGNVFPRHRLDVRNTAHAVRAKDFLLLGHGLIETLKR